MNKSQKNLGVLFELHTEDSLHARLLAICGGNYDKFSPYMDNVRETIKYFTWETGYWQNNEYVIAMDGKTVAGILCYSITKDGPTTQGDYHFLNYVSVHPDYLRQGLAKKMVELWKPTIRKDKGVCGCSCFTASGFNYLRPMLVDFVKCEDKIGIPDPEPDAPKSKFLAMLAEKYKV